ncbi:hypothetical protein AVEN_169796-1 [Araneus ventricosus]|uniref:Uncharacterized protein n=1 Tax=Araneus ventricosus TaxID=182803 RepID=A0A4Y2WB74_ARAVE|nr:hypothetical protein AVEN_169796-1 [Araneus ventricosus]
MEDIILEVDLEEEYQKLQVEESDNDPHHCTGTVCLDNNPQSESKLDQILEILEMTASFSFPGMQCIEKAETGLRCGGGACVCMV